MIRFGSVKGYYFLDAWIMANIIQLGTYRFCSRFLDKTKDPCGRMFDQMTMAARSCSANIAEGCSRHQTSRETELKLLDVARATLSELLNDYFFWSMAEKIELWKKDSKEYRWVCESKLNRPKYRDDWTREAQQHILAEYSRLAPTIEHERNEVVINTMIVLCNRTISMLERLMAALLEEFKDNGGFTENLTKERLETRTKTEESPACPNCGGKMLKRTIRKGAKQGMQFWGCANYPQCNGSRNI